MENKKGNGIFLGIVSVATLIVAIIGATFAYFSANTQSEENAVNVGAYEYNLSLSVVPIYPEGASSLIPLDPDTIIENAEAPNNTNLLYALNVANKRCIDDNGLQVCALYQVEITNGATNPVTLNGQIKTISNEPGSGENARPFENLKYQALEGNHEDNSLSLIDDSVLLDQEVEGLTAISDIVIPGATLNEDGETVPGVGRSYVLIYLDENGNQSFEMGAKYNGQLIYTSQDGIGGSLTGKFTVAGPEA